MDDEEERMYTPWCCENSNAGGMSRAHDRVEARKQATIWPTFRAKTTPSCVRMALSLRRHSQPPLAPLLVAFNGLFGNVKLYSTMVESI